MASITPLQQRIISCCLSIFETSKLPSPKAYGTVTFAAGDKGQLSVGFKQFSLTSGNLYGLTKSYVDSKGKYAKELEAYLDKLKNKSPSVNTDKTLKELYKNAGFDPIMVSTQERYFFNNFLGPAIKEWNRLGFSTGLSALVIIDSFVHGSYGLIRDKTNTQVAVKDEKSWTKKFIANRIAWLKSKGGILAKTTYRSETYKALADAGNWELILPFTAHGFKLTMANVTQGTDIDPNVNETVEPNEIVTSSAEDEKDRLIMVTSPFMKGDDIKEVQEALIKLSLYKYKADGSYGNKTKAAVEAFQRSKGLDDDGIVGFNTKQALGIA